MATYSIQVYLNKLTCRDTESIHSSDKFAMAGAVRTDTAAAGFILPHFAINDSHPSNVRHFANQQIFSGFSQNGRFALVLQAWDIDENDFWVENNEQIIEISSAIAGAVMLVPGGGFEVGTGMQLTIATVAPIIDQFVKWDKNDELLNYGKWWSAPVAGPNQPISQDISITFSGGDEAGHSSWDYTLDLTVTSTAQESFGPAVKLTEESMAGQMFQLASNAAHDQRYEGGYPTFHSEKHGLSEAITDFFLRGLGSLESRTAIGSHFTRQRIAQNSIVAHADLGTPPLDDFRAMMRATSAYCQDHDGVGGFPTFHNIEAPFINTLCGIVIVYPSAADWQSVRLTDLGSLDPADIAGRFVAVHNYAIRRGFIAGFPDFQDTEWGNGVIQCGVVLLNNRAGRLYNRLLGFV